MLQKCNTMDLLFSHLGWENSGFRGARLGVQDVFFARPVRKTCFSHGTCEKNFFSYVTSLPNTQYKINQPIKFA